MTKGIIFYDYQNPFCITSIKKILEIIKAPSNITWCITILDGSGINIDKVDQWELENKIKNSIDGLIVTYEELSKELSSYTSIKWMTLIGSFDPSKLHRYESEEMMVKTVDYSIIRFDETHWIVFAQDENVIENLSEYFKNHQLKSPNFLD